MPMLLHTLLGQYIQGLVKIYGVHLKSVILYGSCAKSDLESAKLLLEAGQYRGVNNRA